MCQYHKPSNVTSIQPQGLTHLHSYTNCTHSPTHSLTLIHQFHPLTHSHSYTNSTQPITHSLTHSHSYTNSTHSLTHSLTSIFWSAFSWDETKISDSSFEPVYHTHPPGWTVFTPWVSVISTPPNDLRDTSGTSFGVVEIDGDLDLSLVNFFRLVERNLKCLDWLRET